MRCVFVSLSELFKRERAYGTRFVVARLSRDLLHGLVRRQDEIAAQRYDGHFVIFWARAGSSTCRDIPPTITATAINGGVSYSGAIAATVDGKKSLRSPIFQRNRRP